MNSDIVKDSTTLKQALLDRWEEIGISHVMVANDAEKRGVGGITPNAISKWIKDAYTKGALNQYQILWLAFRFDIPVRLHVGEPYLEQDKIRYIIPQPFNEERALKRLHEYFPFDELIAKKAERIPVKKKRKKKNG